MTSLGPDAVVQQPLLVPPTLGLLAAANVVEETDERWVNGFGYSPEGCGVAEAFDLCASFTKTVAGAAPPITGTPFGMVAQDTCSAYTKDTRQYEARATRKLLAMESYLLEKELWDGALNINPHLAWAGNPNLVTVTGTINLLTAIPLIEQAAIDAMPGRRIMIHMRPVVLALFMAISPAGTLRYEGGRYYTPNNSIVVPGRGYSGKSPAGTAPNATTESIYATTLVDVRHSPVFTNPPSFAEALDRAENKVTYFAERAGHASFDYSCSVITAAVTKTVTVS